MARYKDLLGGASGKVGSVIAYQMYGKSYMRSLPGQYHDRKSERQLAQRQKMQLVNAFLGPYKEVLRLTFQQQAIGRSAYQAAQSYNLLHAIDGDYPDQYLNYSKALVSKGQVPLPGRAEIQQLAEGILFTWEKDDLGRTDDTLWVICNIRGTYNTTYKHTGAERRDERYLWAIDLGHGELVDIWLVFYDFKEQAFSDSLYLRTLNNK